MQPETEKNARARIENHVRHFNVKWADFDYASSVRFYFTAPAMFLIGKYIKPAPLVTPGLTWLDVQDVAVRMWNEDPVVRARHDADAQRQRAWVIEHKRLV